MREDFSLKELTQFLRRPDGQPIAVTYAQQAWDPAIEKVARAYNYDRDRTLLAIIRLASELADMERRRREEEQFRLETRACD